MSLDYIKPPAVSKAIYDTCRTANGLDMGWTYIRLDISRVRFQVSGKEEGTSYFKWVIRVQFCLIKA